MRRLEGRAALVTGGSRGLGAAIARRLAKEGCGVAIACRSESPHALEVIGEIEATGSTAVLAAGDVGDEGEAKAIVEKAAAKLGGLDIVVNSAGIWLGGRLKEAEVEDWRKIWRINIIGTMQITRAAIPYLEAATEAGGQASIRAILQFTEGRDDWRAFPNLPRREFVDLLLHADVLVGNSTCGIQEAPSLGLPVVNVGPRQIGRLHGDNVLFVSYERRQIVDAIHRALTDSEFLRLVVEKRNPFGDGRTGGRIAGILASLEMGPRLLHKDITF